MTHDEQEPQLEYATLLPSKPGVSAVDLIVGSLAILLVPGVALFYVHDLPYFRRLWWTEL